MFDGTILTSVVWLLLGLGVGVVFGWLASMLRTQKRVTELSMTLEIERTKNAGLALTFEALSDKALRQNNQTFFEIPSLIEEGVKQGVIVATPVTLIALFRAVEFGWRQERLAEHAGQIGNLGRELHDRVCTMGDHFARLGSSLYGAVESYNQTLGSLESRVLVSARKLKELGAADGTKEIGTVEPIDVVPRKLQAPEMRQLS